MKQQTTHEINKLKDIEKAIARKSKQLDKFGKELSNKIEETAPHLQHLAEMAEKDKSELMQLKSETGELLAPMVARARNNPKAFILTAVSLLGGFWIVYNYLFKKAPVSDFQMEEEEIIFRPSSKSGVEFHPSSKF
jgi:hypothetical protein